MNKRTWLVVTVIAGVIVLAAASYMGVSLITTGSVGLGALQLPGAAGSTSQRQGYEVIQPTQVPQRLPDMVGPVVEVKDQSFIVQSHSKGAVDQNGPRTEIVIAADTRVYQDITTRDAASLVGGKLQQRVAPYTYHQIKAGDVLITWGDQRGDRLVAEAVIVEVSSPAAPAP